MHTLKIKKTVVFFFKRLPFLQCLYMGHHQDNKVGLYIAYNDSSTVYCCLSLTKAIQAVKIQHCSSLQLFLWRCWEPPADPGELEPWPV